MTSKKESSSYKPVFMFLVAFLLMFVIFSSLTGNSIWDYLFGSGDDFKDIDLGEGSIASGGRGVGGVIAGPFCVPGNFKCDETTESDSQTAAPSTGDLNELNLVNQIYKSTQELATLGAVRKCFNKLACDSASAIIKATQLCSAQSVTVPQSNAQITCSYKSSNPLPKEYRLDRCYWSSLTVTCDVTCWVNVGYQCNEARSSMTRDATGTTGQ